MRLLAALGAALLLLAMSGGGAAAQPVPEVNLSMDPRVLMLGQSCSGALRQIEAPGFVIERTGDTSTAIQVGYTIVGPATGATVSPVTLESGQESAITVLTASPEARSDDVIIVTLEPGPGYTVGPNRSIAVTVAVHVWPCDVYTVTEVRDGFVGGPGCDVPFTPATIRVDRQPDSELAVTEVPYTFNDESRSLTFHGAGSYVVLQFDQPGHLQLVDGPLYDLGEPSAADVAFHPCLPPEVLSTTLTRSSELPRTGPSNILTLVVVAFALLAVGSALVRATTTRHP